jgi:hypothetical protein
MREKDLNTTAIASRGKRLPLASMFRDLDLFS